MGHRQAISALALAGVLAAGPSWAAGERLPAGLQTRPTEEGLALADAHGRVLYRLDLDRYRARRRQAAPMIAARCANVCDQLWRPVPVPPNFTPAGDWGVVKSPAAAPQLAYKGDPLYSFIGKSLEAAADEPVAPEYFSGYAAKPSGLREGVPTGTVYWHEALYQPPAPDIAAPAGVGLRWAKARYVFADASGKSLYAPVAGAACASGCQDLRPLAAPLAAQPVGAWRPVLAKDGERVWSYRGRIVYQAPDAEPAAGGAWQALNVR